MKIIITGSEGFIAKNFFNYIKNNKKFSKILLLDKVNFKNIETTPINKLVNHFIFKKCNLLNDKKVNEIVNQFKPNIIINFAAETHVDKSIHDPKKFIYNNIFITNSLLQASLNFVNQNKKYNFKFIQISTDEVFGTLKMNEKKIFNENSQYKPNNPYAASKASSDHLVRSFNKTFGLKTNIVHLSNNFGPYQNIEKYIPMIINNIINHKKIPVYGKGNQIRDWLFVEDTSKALLKIISKSKNGENYCLGGGNELSNIDLLRKIFSYFASNFNDGIDYQKLIKFVSDRPGHDKRYALSSKKFFKTYGWMPKSNFNKNLESTILWYLDNKIWLNKVNNKSYNTWYNKNYLKR